MKNFNKLYKNLIIQNCFQNPYMKNYENFIQNNNQNQQQSKQLRSLQQFENLCKELGLYSEYNNQLYQDDDKYIILNLYIYSNNKNQKNRFDFYNNSSQYKQQNQQKFDRIKQFLNKYIITKQGKKQYPIYIIS